MRSLACYALFLEECRHDYDAAERVYEVALETPRRKKKHASLYNNYAVFLKNTRSNFAGAENNYKKAIKLHSEHCNSLGNYGLFHKKISRDYERALFYMVSRQFDFFFFFFFQKRNNENMNENVNLPLLLYFCLFACRFQKRAVEVAGERRDEMKIEETSLTRPTFFFENKNKQNFLKTKKSGVVVMIACVSNYKQLPSTRNELLLPCVRVCAKTKIRQCFVCCYR